MTIPTGIRIGEVSHSKTQMEAQVQEHFREIPRYCTGDELEISKLKITLESANRHFYTIEEQNIKRLKLAELTVSVEATKSSLHKKIDILRATIVNAETLHETTVNEHLNLFFPSALNLIIKDFLGTEHIKE
jgi:hypothetical protein